MATGSRYFPPEISFENSSISNQLNTGQQGYPDSAPSSPHIDQLEVDPEFTHKIDNDERTKEKLRINGLMDWGLWSV